MQNAREILRMDADWLFYKGDPQDAYERNFDDKNWTTLNIPHDWSIDGPFDQSNPSGPDGGFLPGGIGWYRKHFNLTEIDSGKKVYIYFDGIYRNSEVWCNGHFIGKRPSGYMGFYYDLTSYIKCDKPNTIAIRVDNSDQPNSRWYTGSGIYRSVWLTICSPLHINYWGTYITTPQISDTESTVQIETTVTNDFQVAKDFSLETFIYDQANQLVAKQSKQISVKAGKESKIKQIFTLENPNLWSIESPNMYRALSRIVLHNTTIDDYMTPFGIREITFTSNEGMKLNGKTVKLKGVNLHHDAGSVGAAVPIRMIESRLQTLQELGCNAIRCSHNPPAQELLDLCDQMGFLVIAESFDKWWHDEYGYGESFEEWWQIDLEAMLLRDRNHPSIIMWSVGNEVEGQWSKRATDTLTMLVDFVHEFEPTRPVTCAMKPPGLNFKSLEEKIDAIMGMAEHMDIVSLNYQEQWYEDLKKRDPNIIIVGSETYPFFRGNKHSHRAFEPINPWFDVEKNDYVIGQFLWTGIDYIGESPKWPSKGWAASIINTCGFRKPLSYFHQSVWSEDPIVHIAAFDDSIKVPLEKLHWNAPKMASHWNFPHFEDQIIKVVTFTNCEKVKLYVNDELQGVKNLSEFPNRLMTWYIPYESGTIRADGYIGKKKVSVHEMKTAGKPRFIQLTPDRKTITANGQDVSLIEVMATDEQGNCYPYAENEITFELEGEGEIIGVDNGNLDSDEPFKGNKRSLFNGKCFVIVQGNHYEGIIKLKANASELESAEIKITTVKEEVIID